MYNLFIGKTNVDCINSLIEKLKKNYSQDKTTHHIFIVPDRVSVLTEIKIFEALGLESTCNIEISTISRLSSQVITGVNVIPKISSCMLFQKLLKEKRNDLKCFNKKVDSDLAGNLYQTISQFKSCKIPPEKVKVSTQNKILEDKLNDLSILYSSYNKHLKDNNLMDSTDRLDFVVEKVSENEKVKKSFFYFGFFDSFTIQGYQLLSGIIKSCKQFNIGVTGTDSSINEHIFDSNLKDNILKIFELQKKQPNIIFCKENAKDEFKFLQNNLYGFNNFNLKVKKSNIQLFEGKNFEEELLFCCSNIKALLETGNYKFSDIVVAVPSLQEKFNEIEQIFSEYNFSYYLDLSINFTNNILVKLVDDLANMVTENFSKISVISFLKNKMLGISFDKIEDFEDYLIKYNLNNGHEIKNSKVVNNKFYSGFNECREFILNSTDNFFKQIDSAKTYNDFINSFENVLLKLQVPEKLVELSAKFTKQGNIKQAKLFEQYYNSLNAVFDALREVLGNEECDFKLFYSTLQSGLSNTKISTPPLSTNAIFIGDSSTSFFDTTKVYFILNADEKNFPYYMNDCGIISDREIKELSDSYRLEPSIETINNKERFKSFELVLKPSEKLFLSYNFSVSPKSKIFNDISNMIIEDKENGKFGTLEIKNYNSLDFYIINNNRQTAKRNLISNLREIYDGSENYDKDKINLLFSAVNKKDSSVDTIKFDFKNLIKLQQNVFFKKNSVSVSQVESFATCPFLHFVRYGLNLKDKDTGELSNLNIGNILHNVAKLFIDTNSLPINDAIVFNQAEKCFAEVINRDVYESVKNNPFNKVLIKNLLNEAKHFCSILNYQSKFSKFKTFKTEVRFDDKTNIKSLKIKIGNKVLKLVGQVDRIDKFDNYFRIIDYKTGKCDTSLKELFFGKKVQLEAYLKVIENSLKLKPAGSYYMPVKSTIVDEKSTMQLKYQLKGRTILDNNIMIASDLKLANLDTLNSDIVEIKFNKPDKDRNKNLSRYAKVVSSKDIENLSTYAINLISKMCSDILTLNITPSPLLFNSNDDPCKNCNYFALCRFDEKLGNIKRQPTNEINIQSFNNEENK